MAREFDVMNSFTIEASAYSFLETERKTIEFSQHFYQEMGKRIGTAFYDYISLLTEEKMRMLKRGIERRRKKSKPKKTKIIKLLDIPKLLQTNLNEPEEMKVLLQEDTFVNPESYSNKTHKKYLNLKEIYKSIREEDSQIECNSRSNSEDSSNPDNEYLSEEEEKKIVNGILSVINGFQTPQSTQNRPKSACTQSKFRYSRKVNVSRKIPSKKALEKMIMVKSLSKTTPHSQYQNLPESRTHNTFPSKRSVTISRESNWGVSNCAPKLMSKTPSSQIAPTATLFIKSIGPKKHHCFPPPIITTSQNKNIKSNHVINGKGRNLVPKRMHSPCSVLWDSFAQRDSAFLSLSSTLQINQTVLAPNHHIHSYTKNNPKKYSNASFW